MADRTDYSENAAKMEDGKSISAYACDAKTCDEEFLLSKRQYEYITGRTKAYDVIAYQIRQSFKPGEITPEETKNTHLLWLLMLSLSDLALARLSDIVCLEHRLSVIIRKSYVEYCKTKSEMRLEEKNRQSSR